MPENYKYTHRKKIMQKYRINKFIINFLRTKTLIKIKIRDKKKFTKKFHGEGGGAIFLRTIFLGTIFKGHFSGNIFPRTAHDIVCINIWLGNMYYNFRYSANMLSIRSRGFDHPHCCIA